MNSIQMLFCVLFVLQAVLATTKSSKCEPLKIKMCQNLNYNKTMLPNFAKHRSQWEAAQSLQTIVPLVKSGCTKDLLQIICLFYAPACNKYGILVPPCRSVCRKVKKDCTATMNKLNVAWPAEFNCKNFPKRKKNAVCFGRPRTRKSVRTNKIPFSFL